MTGVSDLRPANGIAGAAAAEDMSHSHWSLKTKAFTPQKQAFFHPEKDVVRGEVVTPEWG